MIKYKARYKEDFLTEQEALRLGEYTKLFYENGLIHREEDYYQSKISMETIHNIKSEDHQVLLKKYPEAMIADHISYDNGYRLKTIYSYDENYELYFTFNCLYDVNDIEIAAETIVNQENDKIQYRSKEYWDLDKSPKKELFETEYSEAYEIVVYLYFNEEHYNNSGQDSFALGLDEIDKVMNITGISRELAVYYFTPDVVPNWKKTST